MSFMAIFLKKVLTKKPDNMCEPLLSFTKTTTGDLTYPQVGYVVCNASFSSPDNINPNLITTLLMPKP